MERRGIYNKAPSTIEAVERGELTKPSKLDWWYRMAAPPEPSASASIQQREAYRRGKLIAIVLGAVAIVATIGTLAGILILHNINQILTVSPCIVVAFFTALLNRRGQVVIAGILMVLVAEASVMGSVVAVSLPAMSVYALPVLDLLVLPEIIAVSLLPPAFVFMSAVMNIAFIVSTLTFLFPHNAELIKTLHASLGDAVARPVVIQILTAVVSFLWVRSAEQAIYRANRATTIATLEHDMAEQAHAIAQQKRRLDASIQQIVETHTRVANGDLKARVPLTQGNVLWEVAGALNNLLSRFQRAVQAERRVEELQRQGQWAHQVEYRLRLLKQEIEKQASIIRSAKRSRRPVRFNRTETMIDPLLVELDGAMFFNNTSPLERSPETKSSPLRESVSGQFSSLQGSTLEYPSLYKNERK